MNIFPNLDISICNLSGSLDNLENKTLEEIWNKEYSAIAKNRVLLGNDEYPESCRYCNHQSRDCFVSYIELSFCRFGSNVTCVPPLANSRASRTTLKI